MFKNKVMRYSTIAMLVAIVAYFLVETFSSQKTVPGIVYTRELNPSTYADMITRDRRDSQKWFLTSEDSPIENPDDFKGLSFFEPDLKFRVVADIESFKGEDKILEIRNTDGSTDTYEKYAYASFEIDNSPQKLLLLKHEGLLSLMWKDATSGKTSYGGGRYLDFALSDIKGNQMVIDFNKAYNPYCAYSPKYACPLPPAENTLTESITAGEKFTAEK